MTTTRLKSCFLYSCISVITLLFCFCESVSAFKSPYFKLPSTVFPTKYHLHITTYFHENILVYNGSVSIDLTIREPTTEIVLNSKELEHFNISLTNLESGLFLESPQLEYKIDEEKEQLRVHWPMFPLKLKIGQQYRLKIDFVGNIQKVEIFGFMKSTFLDENDKSVSLAVTHFEPTSARLAFPCFDEPAFKAKFVISITHATNYTALSNMPADDFFSNLSPASNGEMVTTKFMETPIMSTYLVAFALSNFNKTSVSVNGIEHRYFHAPKSKQNGSRALENAIKSVDAFVKLLGIKPTLPKLDHIVTGRLYGIAMENWGLMTFEQTYLVPNQNDYNKLHLIFRIIIQNHELAHLWFGNLVTPESWNYVWMKEGFSTYFSYLATNLVYPEEKILDYFLIKEVSELDGAHFNRPLTSAIEEGADIKEHMNIVSYELSASIIRMFHHAIGHNTFMKGIFKYLSIFQFSVANEDDFFMTMQAAVDEDKVHLFQNNESVANVMRTWTHNVGIPVVTIIRNYETGTITIRQRSNSENKDQKWWIPMNFATAVNPDFERTMVDYIMPPQAEVTLDLKDLNINISNSDWLLVNKQQTGIFYIIYDDINLKLITEALIGNQKTIHPLNRALILRDFSLTLVEELDSIESLLEFVQYLKLEEESLPWVNIIDLIMNLLSRLEGSKISDKFKYFVYNAIIGIYDSKYRNPSETLSAADLMAKDKILRLKNAVDTITCQNYTKESAKEYFLSGVIQTLNPCKVSLCQAIENSTYEEFRELYQTIRSLDYELPYPSYDLFIALKCIKSEEIFEHVYIFLEISKRFEFFDHLLVSNEFFEKWFQSRYKPNEIQGKVDSTAEKIEKYRNEKIRIREKYENKVRIWFESNEKTHRGKLNQII